MKFFTLDKRKSGFMSKNTNLHDAKRAKQDEFYTQWVDIEKEMNAYLDYNPDVFKGKTILLPCDDPEWSNFTRFFASRFDDLGIRRLISTSYTTQNDEDGQYCGRGEILIIDGTEENNDRGEELKWEYLQGDGDFRSDEVIKLRDEADMVITNPPFSLFREFMTWLVEGDVEFAVIGNMNAITYKEIFPLIKDNKLWVGASGMQGITYEVPVIGELAKGQYEENGKRYQKMGNTCWFTNIQHGRRHDPLPLMTMDDNLRFNNRIMKNPNSYKTYDNYDAIEVPVTAGIPSDYDGVMGVPISFLDKYNPEQFEIIKFRHGDDGKDLRYTLDDGKSKTPYFRILIQHKKNNEQE